MIKTHGHDGSKSCYTYKNKEGGCNSAADMHIHKTLHMP
jgi:hypothetical protein